MAISVFDTFVSALSAADPEERERVLGKEAVIFPPAPDLGYPETPMNGLAFGTMGVDGVHYVALTRDGRVPDDLPVVHVSPMDSDCYAILAPTFPLFLASACGTTATRVEQVVAEERSRGDALVPFMQAHYALEGRNLLAEDRQRGLANLLDRIERKPSS